MSVRSAVGFKGGDIPTGNQDLQQVLENGNDAGGLNMLDLGEIFVDDIATFNEAIFINNNKQILQSPASTGLLTGLNVLKETIIKSNNGATLSPTLEILDNDVNKGLFVIVNSADNGYNPIVGAGDTTIISANANNLSIAPASGTTSGIRLSTTGTLIGFGGTADTPTSNVNITSAGVAVAPSITFPDNSVQTTAFTGNLPTDNLSNVLLAGNNAGTSSLDMNGQGILGVNNIDVTTINNSAYPPAPPPSVVSVIYPTVTTSTQASFSPVICSTQIVNIGIYVVSATINVNVNNNDYVNTQSLSIGTLDGLGVFVADVETSSGPGSTGGSQVSQSGLTLTSTIQVLADATTLAIQTSCSTNASNTWFVVVAPPFTLSKVSILRVA